MMRFFFHEFREIKKFLKENYKVILILSVATLSLILQWYRPKSPSSALNQIIYFLLLPFFTIYFLLKDNPSNYGFGLGDFSIWIKEEIRTGKHCNTNGSFRIAMIWQV